MYKLHDNYSSDCDTRDDNVHVVIKAIGNSEERKINHSTKTQDFNVENPLQQREVKTTGASQQNFTISVVCLQTPWVIL
jgi:hypothetical protein